MRPVNKRAYTIGFVIAVLFASILSGTLSAVFHLDGLSSVFLGLLVGFTVGILYHSLTPWRMW